MLLSPIMLNKNLHIMNIHVAINTLLAQHLVANISHIETALVNFEMFCKTCLPLIWINTTWKVPMTHLWKNEKKNTSCHHHPFHFQKIQNKIIYIYNFTLTLVAFGFFVTRGF